MSYIATGADIRQLPDRRIHQSVATVFMYQTKVERDEASFTKSRSFTLG